MAEIKHQSFSRPPWERMMRFHNLIKENSFPNCTRLAGEFEVTVRTVMRDVDFMKCRLELPIEFDTHRNGYYYTAPILSGICWFQKVPAKVPANLFSGE
jgi:hypothetical protein